MPSMSFVKPENIGPLLPASNGLQHSHMICGDAQHGRQPGLCPAQRPERDLAAMAIADLLVQQFREVVYQLMCKKGMRSRSSYFSPLEGVSMNVKGAAHSMEHERLS
jgi:hypothetical protein